MAAQPVELILARNLVSGLELAAFLVDLEGVVVFFNDAAGALLGRRFDEVGRLGREEWNSRFGPFDELGKVLPTKDLPLTLALRKGLPANGRFRIRAAGDEMIDAEISALPLTGADGFKGALVVFWRAEEDDS